MTEGDRYADAIASLAKRHGFRVGVAESLTCGKLAAQLGAAPNASDWFRGGVVAYASEVKFDLLDVTPGPVVTAECARQMALGVAKVLDADATVSVTGVGGPDPEEGQPPGTVHVAAWVRGVESRELLQIDGDPPDVLARTIPRALEILLGSMHASVHDHESGPGVNDASRGTSVP